MQLGRITMLMKWSINPINLSINNIYLLEFRFENDENIKYSIKKVILKILDLNLQFSKKINQELREPLFGLFNKKIYVSFSFKLEKKIVSTHKFIVQTLISKFIDEQWAPEFILQWAPQSFQIKPIPIYKAFLSRSIRDDERDIPDYISKSITRWGFNLSTMGIPPLRKQFSDEDLLEAIKYEIQRADIVFAIATKRARLLNSVEWKTFEWLQSETAIAYALNKQIVVFVEKGVKLTGLASKIFVLEFDPEDIYAIDRFFDQYMTQIRNNIQKSKNSEFLWNLVKAGGIIGGLGLFGAIAYDLGREDSKNDKYS
jgi:hypothetical protein